MRTTKTKALVATIGTLAALVFAASPAVAAPATLTVESPAATLDGPYTLTWAGAPGGRVVCGYSPWVTALDPQNSGSPLQGSFRFAIVQPPCVDGNSQPITVGQFGTKDRLYAKNDAGAYTLTSSNGLQLQIGNQTSSSMVVPMTANWTNGPTTGTPAQKMGTLRFDNDLVAYVAGLPVYLTGNYKIGYRLN